MKRLVVIVPDTIIRRISNFKEIHTQVCPTTGQRIIAALELDAYDESYSFPNGTVRVVSIEDC